MLKHTADKGSTNQWIALKVEAMRRYLLCFSVCLCLISLSAFMTLSYQLLSPDSYLGGSKLITVDRAEQILDPEGASTKTNEDRLQARESTCDFHRYRDSVILDRHSPYLATNYLDTCSGVVYNRVPKAASRTMLDVFRELSSQRDFTVIFHDRSYIINDTEKQLYIDSMTAVENNRFVLISHHYYHNFTRYEPHPQIYINIIREPVSWFQSIFNWHREFYHNQIWWSKMPISECIAKNKCFEFVRRKFGPMKFLCGHHSQCRKNSKGTLQIVKQRLDEDYLLVGVLEQLDEFIEVLEYLMPNMFAGLKTAFDKIESKSHAEFKTKSKESISAKTLERLKTKMNYENDVYYYAKEKFNSLLAVVRQLKAEGKR